MVEKDGLLNLNFLEGYVGEKAVKRRLHITCGLRFPLKCTDAQTAALHGISSL